MAEETNKESQAEKPAAKQEQQKPAQKPAIAFTKAAAAFAGNSMLRYPVTTEKAVGLIERQNKMLFVVDSRATKKGIKEEVEATFSVKVEKVNMMIPPDGRKKAFVKLAKGYSADDIAARLKIA